MLQGLYLAVFLESTFLEYFLVTAPIVYSRHLKRFIALLHMKLIFRRKGRLRFHIYELNMTDM